MGKSNSKTLTKEDIDYLTQKTDFNISQILDKYAEFKNQYPKGVISKHKFSKLFMKYYPNGKGELFCEYLFNVIDSNKNGELDFSEFLIAVSFMKGNLSHKLALIFRMYDLDGNEKIDLKELTRVMIAIYEIIGLDGAKNNGPPVQKAKEIIQKFDKNNDNKLTQREFINGCLQDNELRDLLMPLDFNIFEDIH